MPEKGAAAVQARADQGVNCALCAAFLMFTTTSWAEASTTTTIITYAMAYGGFAQMVAGVLEVSIRGGSPCSGLCSHSVTASVRLVVLLRSTMWLISPVGYKCYPQFCMRVA